MPIMQMCKGTNPTSMLRIHNDFPIRDGVKAVNFGLGRPFDRASATVTKRSNVKFEVEHIAIVDHILFAFLAQFARIARL